MKMMKYFQYNPSPDFLGIPHHAKPIFVSTGEVYGKNIRVLTLDFQAVPRNEATGEVSEEQ